MSRCSASGQWLVNVDFTARDVTEKVGFAAFGTGDRDLWNTYTRRSGPGGFQGSGTIENLRRSDGVETGVSLTVENAPGAFGNGVSDPMYGSYVYSFDGEPITVQMRRLEPGSYTLYLYGHAGPGVDAANTDFEIRAGGSVFGAKATTVGPEWNSTNWNEGDQFVRFSSVVVGVGETLEIQARRAGYREPYLNGLQIFREGSGDGSGILMRPSGGVFTNSVRVAITALISGAEIRYTLDGTEPIASSPRFESSFELTQSATVKARLFVNGFPAGEVVNAHFEADPGIYLVPSGRLFTNRIDVAILSRIQGVRVFYSEDGSAPDINSSEYISPIRLTAAATLRVRAYLNGFPVTTVITGRYERVYAFGHDGIPSAWRTQFFGDSYLTDPRADADADPDLDGTSNRQEFASNTDPLNPLSGFAVGVRALPEIRFASKIGSRYRIERRGNLGGESTVVADVVAEETETRWVDVAAGVVVNPAFYTVVPVP